VAPAPPGGAAAGEPVAWEVVASADHDYFTRVAPEGVTFPPHCPDRSFAVSGVQVRIGRRSPSRGVAPEIDLSGAPEDPAISHLHALLLRQADGSYALVDPGSTNGTTVNAAPDPIEVNVAVPVKDGDRIHIGAWTTLTLRSLSNA
jgi:FHA domain